LVTSTPDNVEVVRTALARSADGRQVGSVTAQLVAQETLLGDLRRVTVIGLVAAVLLSGCSAAITTAGSVLDRRRTFGALMAAGTPVRTLSKALRTEAAMPALVATIGAGAVGVVIGIGLLYPITTAPPVITPWVLAPVVLGIVTAVIAASVCTPALKRVGAGRSSGEGGRRGEPSRPGRPPVPERTGGLTGGRQERFGDLLEDQSAAFPAFLTGPLFELGHRAEIGTRCPTVVTVTQRGL